jgi:hypothetical protein
MSPFSPSRCAVLLAIVAFISLWLFLLLSVLSTGELLDTKSKPKMPFQLKQSESSSPGAIVLRRRDVDEGQQQHQRALNIPNRYVVTNDVAEPPSLEEVRNSVDSYIDRTPYTKYSMFYQNTPHVTSRSRETSLIFYALCIR